MPLPDAQSRGRPQAPFRRWSPSFDHGVRRRSPLLMHQLKPSPLSVTMVPKVSPASTLERGPLAPQPATDEFADTELLVGLQTSVRLPMVRKDYSDSKGGARKKSPGLP